MDEDRTIYYDNRQAGDGKTFEQLKRLASTPGLYIFAADRREILPERVRSLDEAAYQAGTIPHIVEIFSDDGRGGGVQSVRISIEALSSIYTSGHVIALVCHAGLKAADLSDFGEWHLVIDEAPSFFDRSTVSSSVSAPLLRELFEIVPGEHLTHLVPRYKITRRDLHLDTVAAPLATLHALASDGRNQVITHLRSWDDVLTNPHWTWWSLWSPRQLSTFASVVVLAAAFERSLTLRLCKALAPELRWLPLISPAPKRAYTPRTLTVRYFAHAHNASRHRFDSPPGKTAIAKIAAHLALQPEERIWTSNKAEHPMLARWLPRGYLRPQQAGSNAWSHIDEAVIIFTSKPDRHERAILAALEVDADAVIESRERDTIYQFIGRTSLRDPDSNRPVTAYVYDRVQAEAVAAAFAGRPGLSVELELVDLGFAHDVAGRVDLSRMTPEDRKHRKRTQARERKRNQRERQSKRKQEHLW